MATTSPDSIYFPSANDSIAPLETVFANLASSVQTSLNSRALRGYRWANAAARTAQTGMANGDRGFQVDTKGEYTFFNGAWVATQTMGQSVFSAWNTNNTVNLANTPVLFKTGIVSGTTGSGGTLNSNFASPFPTNCLFVTLQPLNTSNVGSAAPVVIDNSVDRTGFNTFWASRGSAAVRVPYLAIGY